MASFKIDDKQLNITIDINELNDSQVRLIKTMNSMFSNIMKTSSEAEFFDTSAEMMRICASIIKQSDFAKDLKMNGIPYAEQALEYSMDIVAEQMINNKIVTYDN